MSEVTEKLYDNLCTNFNWAIDKCLGRNYYNMGQDVYTTHILACQDLVKEFEGVKHERNQLKKQNDRLEILLYLSNFGFFGVLIALLISIVG